CRRWLAEARKTAKKQPIASSSGPSSSTEEKGQSLERRLAEGRKTAKKQPIASSSMPSSSTEEKGQSIESQERLATFEYIENTAQVRILNPENSKLEIKLQLPAIECANIFAFRNKLVLIGGLEIKNNSFTRRVDLMDLSTGQVSSLPDMINAMCFPVGVGTENEIFVFGSELRSGSPVRFLNEIYDAASGRWSLLSPMIEERPR
ncbi:unnamed protein product, partial [Hymenolepis diminuta]